MGFSFIPSILPKCIMAFSNHFNIPINAKRAMEQQGQICCNFVLHSPFLILLLDAERRGNCEPVGH